MKWLVYSAAAAIGALRFLGRGRVPDDYDAIGFVRAVGDFDLAKLQPHFPGYPVHVALGKFVHASGVAPLDALCVVTALAAAATAIALYHLAARLGGPRAGAATLALYAGAALPWVLGGSALSDGTAAAFAAGAFALGLGGWRFCGGVAIALMLGARASYWPIAVSWAFIVADRQAAEVRRGLPRSDRGKAVWLVDRRALLGAVAGAVAWIAPFVAVVGPRALWQLGRTHVAGHFTIWGGSIVTQPSPLARGSAFVRGLFFDGLAPSWPLLVAVLALLAMCARRPSPSTLRRALLVAGPYALWVLVAQNVVEQPRHLLPLLLALLVVIGVAAARMPRIAAALALLVATAGVPVAFAHAREKPAAAQAADWVAANFAPDDVVVFGTRSVRFFDERVVTRQRDRAEEIWVDLIRLARLPPTILVTSEVEGAPSHDAVLSDGPTFCRDARVDRAQACLTLRRYIRHRAPQ